MAPVAFLEDVVQLPTDERLELIGIIWDSINRGALPVTEAELEMLAQCDAEYEADPTAGRPWENVYADLQSRLP